MIFTVTIDLYSGFCHGVVKAIAKAEKELEDAEILYCLGDIVHNSKEVERLKNKGLVSVTHKDIKKLTNIKLLIRAHGEPPATYKKLKNLNIKLIDASCAVVLSIQRRIKKAYEESKINGGQIVIYGKEGHPEVIGLVGQTDGKAIIIKEIFDLERLDFGRPIELFSQTTMEPEGYKRIEEEIIHRYKNNNQPWQILFKKNESICREVSNRKPKLRKFCSEFDVIIFVSDKKSSNGNMLYNSCKDINNRSFFISDIDELKKEWFQQCNSVGISGATSTPLWLMEKVKDQILTFQ